MTKTIAIRLALGGLLIFGAAACGGDDKNANAGSSSAPPTAGTPSGGTTASVPPSSAPPSSAPATSTPPTPGATATKPEITNSKQIVMIDPDGKRYTFTTMVQMAAGMRATMGEQAPPDFCEKSYLQGVKGGGSFPAGRAVFLAACHEGWSKGERYMQQQ